MIEKIIKSVYRLYRANHRDSKSSCPSEEDLVCYCEGRLSGVDSEVLARHFISCPRCAESALVFTKKLQENKVVPASLFKQIESCLSPKDSSVFLQIALAVKEKTLQIISTTAQVLLDNQIIPAPVLRSRDISEFSAGIKLVKEYKGIMVNVDIQNRGKNQVRFSLKLMHKNRHAALPGLRLALLKEDKELESYTAESGNVVFDKLAAGKYIVELIHKADKLGRIHLEIK